MVTDADERIDVRELDGPPFGPITDALGSLDDGETLLLVSSFEPEPLYAVATERGFDHETTRVTDDEWQVTFTRA